MNDLYNMIFKTDPYKTKEKNNNKLKHKKKKNEVKIIKKKLRIVDKPEIININDVNPVTDWAPQNLDAELEREIRNAELQNVQNEENIYANPLQNIDRSVVMNYIDKIKEDHAFKQNLALQVGESYAKEEFFTEMIGLKDLQDELAKNATEIHKLKTELMKMDKGMKEKTLKGTPIKKTRELEDIDKMDIEKEEKDKNDYLNMKLRLWELEKANKELAKQEENLKQKYEKAMKNGNLKHITSSFNMQKLHLNKQIEKLKTQLNANANFLDRYKTENNDLKYMIWQMKNERNDILNKYQLKEQHIFNLEQKYNEKIKNIDQFDETFKQVKENFENEINQYKNEKNDLINEIRNFKIKEMLLKILLDKKKKFTKKESSSIKKDFSEWFHTPKPSSSKKSESSKKTESSDSSGGNNGGGGGNDKPDDDNDNDNDNNNDEERKQSDIIIENKEETESEDEYDDLTIEQELKNLLSKYNIKYKIDNRILWDLNQYIIDLKNETNININNYMDMFNKYQNERKEKEKINNEKLNIESKNIKISKENKNLEDRIKRDEEINQLKQEQYEKDIITRENQFREQYTEKFKKEYDELYKTTKENFEKEIERYKQQIKNQFDEAIKNINKDQIPNNEKKNILAIEDEKYKELLEQLDKFKSSEFQLLNKKQELELVVDDLTKKDELTKKEKDELLREKQKLENEKQQLFEEVINYRKELDNRITEYDYMDAKVRNFENAMQQLNEDNQIKDYNFEQMKNYLMKENNMFKIEKQNNDFQIKILNDQNKEIETQFKEYINQKESEKNNIIQQAWDTINELKNIIGQKDELVNNLEIRLKQKSAEKMNFSKEYYLEHIKDQDYIKYKNMWQLKSDKNKTKEQKREYITQKEKEYNDQLERQQIREEMIEFNKKEKQIDKNAEICNKKLLKFFRDKNSPERLKNIIQIPISDYGFNPLTPTKPYIHKDNFNFPPNIWDFNQGLNEYHNEGKSEYGYNPYVKNINQLPPKETFKEHMFDYDSISQQLPITKTGTESFKDMRDKKPKQKK